MIGHERLERSAAALNGLARRAADAAPAALRFAPRSFRLAPTIEVLLALALGLVVALTALALFSPPPVPERPSLPPRSASGAAADPSDAGDAEVALNPFRLADKTVGATAASGAASAMADGSGEALAETTLDLKLHGVWFEEDGGAAMIRTPDKLQKRFVVGDEIWNGVVLDRVYRDRVAIRRAGVREALSLVNREKDGDRRARGAPARERSAVGEAAGPARPSLSTSAASERGESRGGADIGDIVRIKTRRGGDGLEVRLYAGRDLRAFRALGLRPGDRLVAVDNTRIGSDIAGVMQKLRNPPASGKVDVLIERKGVSVPLSIDVSDIGRDESARDSEDDRKDGDRDDD